MKNIIIIYHGECPDGFGGAWAAWKKFGAKAAYIGAKDRVNPPKGLRGKEVYFIDWVYPVETMAKIMKDAKKVVALDHHVTAKEATEMANEHRYSLNHSGAVLAWKYFHPQEPLPKLLAHIEDMDLWQWRLPKSKEVVAELEMHPFELREWDKHIRAFEDASKRKLIIEKGALLLDYQSGLIDQAASKASPVLFEGRRVLAANSPLFHSELGSLLCEKKPPFAIVWWMSDGGKTRVSLRSRNGFDVSKLAAKYGGGGHKAASGFTLPPGSELPWKNI